MSTSSMPRFYVSPGVPDFLFYLQGPLYYLCIYLFILPIIVIIYIPNLLMLSVLVLISIIIMLMCLINCIWIIAF